MRGDWVALVESAHAPAADDRAWAQRLTELATPVFGPNVLVGFNAIRHPPDSLSAELVTVAATLPTFDQHTAMLFELDRWPELGARAIRELYYPGPIVCLLSDIISRMPEQERGMMADFQAAFRVKDAIGLVVHPEPGSALSFFAGFSERQVVSRHKRELLARVALHIETAYRLRRRPESVVAVVSSDGTIVHHAPGAPDAKVLASRARSIERARSPRERSAPDAIALWGALVGGRVSLVERTEGTRRHYLVVENAPARQPLRSFTGGEIDVLSYAARGLSAKLVSYALGISEPEVSSRLASAASKVGVATRMELVRLAAMLTRDPRARFQKTVLTTAERDVMDLLSRGLSNTAIAAIRQRSVRTIANQVARLLRKTGSPSRRALVARVP